MDMAKVGQAIARIYDAALTPRNWSGVLEDVANAVGAKGSVIIHAEPGYTEVVDGGVYHTDLFTDENIRDYTEKYAREDRLDLILSQPQLSIVTLQDVLDQDPGFANNTLNRRYREEFEIWERAAAPLQDVPSWQAMAVVLYDSKRSAMTTEERAVYELLLPHIAKAVQVNRPVRLLEARFRAVLDALDRILIGVAIVTSDRHVVMANRRMCEILEERDGLLQSTNGVLRAADTNARLALDQAVTRASATSVGDDRTDETLLMLPRKQRNGLLIEVCPLRDRDQGLDPSFAGALVYAIDPDNEDAISTKGLEALFKLSKTENQIAGYLAAGLSNAEIADRRNVSPETVKSQVKAVLAKTGTANRFDFLRLALKVNVPVESRD
jgi:DNA-binding CsgD family transcriptional regulator/PAS domain-containing protein